MTIKKQHESAKFFWKGQERHISTITDTELKELQETSPAFVAEHWEPIPKAKKEEVKVLS